MRLCRSELGDSIDVVAKTRVEDTLEAEGLPTKIMPASGLMQWGERATYKIYVPKGREHVADEILRKL